MRLSEYVEDRIERAYREKGARLWRALVAHCPLYDAGWAAESFAPSSFLAGGFPFEGPFLPPPE